MHGTASVTTNLFTRWQHTPYYQMRRWIINYQDAFCSYKRYCDDMLNANLTSHSPWTRC